MHLSALEISNFLAYVDAELPLGSNGLMLVIGPNNAGKSALLRAMDVVADIVRGGNWRRAGSTDFARVSATFTIDDDGERAVILGNDAHPGWRQQLREIRFEWEDRTASEMLLTSISIASDEGVVGTVFSADYSSTGSSFSAAPRKHGLRSSAGSSQLES
jgi:energy-coupling factor transporter ATP-binding protein EcfA2